MGGLLRWAGTYQISHLQIYVFEATTQQHNSPGRDRICQVCRQIFNVVYRNVGFYVLYNTFRCFYNLNVFMHYTDREFTYLEIA